MKKNKLLLFIFLLSFITSLVLTLESKAQFCPGITSIGTSKAKVFHSCYDTVGIYSKLKRVDADSVSISNYLKMGGNIDLGTGTGAKIIGVSSYFSSYNNEIDMAGSGGNPNGILLKSVSSTSPTTLSTINMIGESIIQTVNIPFGSTGASFLINKDQNLLKTFDQAGGYTYLNIVKNNIGLNTNSTGSVILTTNNVTSDVGVQFPNASGTLALTSDLNSYLPLVGGNMSGGINDNSAVNSVGITSRLLYNSVGRQTLDFNNKKTVGSSGYTIDWELMKLLAGGSTFLDWNLKSFYSGGNLIMNLSTAGAPKFYNSAGTFYNSIISTPTANRVITIPDATGRVVFNDNTATFTNKSGNISQWTNDVGYGTGSGSVTSVSVTSANGVSGTVATSTTTPAITLSLGAITPATINGVSLSGVGGATLNVGGAGTTISGTHSGNSSGNNSGDQTNISGNAGTATSLQTGTTIGITGDVTYTSPSFSGTSNITSTSTVTKINGTSLAGLTTGILKNTTSTGIPSIAVNTDLPLMTSTQSGAVPTPPNNTTTFLRGDGTFSAVSGFATQMSIVANGTDANYTAVSNSIIYLPVATLTANRNIIIPTGTNGDLLEIYNNEIAYSWNLAGASVYLSDGTTILSSLYANTNHLIRKVNGLWRILN